MGCRTAHSNFIARNTEHTTKYSFNNLVKRSYTHACVNTTAAAAVGPLFRSIHNSLAWTCRISATQTNQQTKCVESRAQRHTKETKERRDEKKTGQNALCVNFWMYEFFGWSLFPLNIECYFNGDAHVMHYSNAHTHAVNREQSSPALVSINLPRKHCLYYIIIAYILWWGVSAYAIMLRACFYWALFGFFVGFLLVKVRTPHAGGQQQHRFPIEI